MMSKWSLVFKLHSGNDTYFPFNFVSRQKWFDDRLAFANQISPGMRDKIKYLTITEPGKVMPFFLGSEFYKHNFRCGCRIPFSGTKGSVVCTMCLCQISMSVSTQTAPFYSGYCSLSHCFVLTFSFSLALLVFTFQYSGLADPLVPDEP